MASTTFVGSAGTNAWPTTRSRPVTTVAAAAIIDKPNARWAGARIRPPPIAAIVRRPSSATATSEHAAPATYATATASAPPEGPATTAVVITAAMIGPTHGAQI